MKRNPLIDQVNKMYKHLRMGSIDTRRRYKKAMLRFAEWLHSNYGTKKLENVSNKHLADYVSHLLSEGNKASYITTELAAIRYYHDHLANPRYNLERNNSKLGVPHRKAPGDRAWTQEEFEALINIAIKQKREWIAEVLHLQKELGLRIHEVTRLSRNDAEKALAIGELVVKGKGGKIRDTRELTPKAKEVLKSSKERVSRGEKLFVPPEQKTHVIIAKIQNFIYVNRPLRENGSQKISSHGLRYNFAQQRYSEIINKSNKAKAEKSVSVELGHNRPRVTRGYLSCRKGGE